MVYITLQHDETQPDEANLMQKLSEFYQAAKYIH